MSKIHHQSGWYGEDKASQLGKIPVGLIRSRRPNNVSPPLKGSSTSLAKQVGQSLTTKESHANPGPIPE